MIFEQNKKMSQALKDFELRNETVQIKVTKGKRKEQFWKTSVHNVNRSIWAGRPELKSYFDITGFGNPFWFVLYLLNFLEQVTGFQYN